MKQSLPISGSVLGVDVGFSLRHKSSAVCRLDWTSGTVCWKIERFCAKETERTETLKRVADRPLCAAAFDGPLRRGFDVIRKYRVAEQMLTLGLQPFIGKPGQSSAPVGRALNEAANRCVNEIKKTKNVDRATHPQSIDEDAIVEAFPSSFLGVLIEAPKNLTVKRRDRSDLFYRHLTESGGIQELLQTLLPGRQLSVGFDAVKNHDDRAGLVCALTALCVAAKSYVAVGDENGWIILPPRELVRRWAFQLLEANAVAAPERLVSYRHGLRDL